MNPAVELLVNSLSSFLSIYLVLLFIRILLSWFPNINWYDPPFSLLGQLTDPYLNLFRSIIPPSAVLTFPLSSPSSCCNSSSSFSRLYVAYLLFKPPSRPSDKVFELGPHSGHRLPTFAGASACLAHPESEPVACSRRKSGCDYTESG